MIYLQPVRAQHCRRPIYALYRRGIRARYFIRDTDGLSPPDGSKFLLTRQDGDCSVLQLYYRGENLTQVSGRGYTELGKGGRVDVQIEQVNPADLAGFSLFRPCRHLLPVDAELGFELGTDGTPGVRGQYQAERRGCVVERRFGLVALS